MEYFDTVLRPDENGLAFFIEVPADVVAALSTRKRPPVRATLNGYPYRTTISCYGGQFYLPVRREIREAAGVTAGANVTVGLALDEEPRAIEPPEDLRRALEADPVAGAAFERLSYTHRREYVEWVAGAKRGETRRRRIDKTVAMLKAGRKEP